MPLRIKLKPFERLIIGDAAIRNGSKRTEFIIETQSKILRESEIMTETEANTPCKRLYVALEHVYLANEPFEAETAFMGIASEIMRAAPTTGPYILAIYEKLEARDFYRALREAKKLIAYETELLEGLLGSLDSGPEVTH